MDLQFIFNIAAGGLIGWFVGLYMAWKGRANRYNEQATALRQILLYKEGELKKLRESRGKE